MDVLQKCFDYSLAEELRTRRQRYGIATLCIGGGQGQALVLEAA